MALTVAAPAGATSVNSLRTRLEITGDRGEANRLTVRFDLTREVIRITDSQPITVTSAAGHDCSRVSGAVECPWPAPPASPPFVIDLGDRNDRLAIQADRVSPEIYAGASLNTEVRDGPGDDRATSVPTGTRYVNGPGNDVLAGATISTAGGGNDTITGTIGPDLLRGGPGRDVIRGGEGADVIRGDSGDDRLFGQGGTDRLFGGVGNDYLRGGGARDRLFGGPGRNTLIQS